MVSKETYLAQATRRFGRANPERMDSEHWIEMVRTGEGAHVAAAKHFGYDFEANRFYGNQSADGPQPRWCFDRFGMTRTRLPGGQVVCVAGEHEDYYDPDFCIYNDVVVIAPGGGVSIFGYPKDLFPPTDFHSATLIDPRIVLVGSLGYSGRRAFGHTPVYELHLESFAIRPLETSGDAPGWVYRHLAHHEPVTETIRVAGGEVAVAMDDRRQPYPQNGRVYRLDLRTLRWTSHDEPWRAVPIPEVDWPRHWRPVVSARKAWDLADALARSVAPGHPLFADEYEPVAHTGDNALATLLRSRADPELWLVSEGPTYTGRAEQPLKYDTYRGLASWRDAAAGRGEWWWR